MPAKQGNGRSPSSAPSAPGHVERLQRAAGNRAVTAALAVQRGGPTSQEPENVCREPVHRLTYQGTRYEIPQSQWTGFVAGLKRIFRSEVLRPIESRMSSARGLYDAMKELNSDQWAVSWFLEAVRTGINLDEVAPLVIAGEEAVRRLQTLAAGEDLPAIEAATRVAQEKADVAYRAIHEYRARQMRTGEITIVALEVTQTVCFTVFAVAGGAVLAAPVAVGGLGLGAVSSGAIMGGGTALLSSAAGTGAKAVYGEEVGWADVKNMTLDTVVGAAGGAAGSAVAARLTPYLAPALTRSLLANGLFKNVSEEALSNAVRSVVSGSTGGVVQGAISDGVRVLQGKATMDQLLRNVVVNLIAGGVVSLVAGRLTALPPSGAAPVASTPQTRNVRVANPRLVAEYERVANDRMPQAVVQVLARERGTTVNRARLAQLQTDFDALRLQVGNAQTLTPQQRARANAILREARSLGDSEYSALQPKVMKQLRKDPALQAIENQLVAAGDAEANPTGTLRIKVVRADNTEAFEPLNIEHRVRKSDNPWLTKDPRNLVLTDAPQNQQYLEALRQQGSVWPTTAVEEFVVRHQLNDQNIDFAPNTR